MHCMHAQAMAISLQDILFSVPPSHAIVGLCLVGACQYRVVEVENHISNDLQFLILRQTVDASVAFAENVRRSGETKVGFAPRRSNVYERQSCSSQGYFVAAGRPDVWRGRYRQCGQLGRQRGRATHNFCHLQQCRCCDRRFATAQPIAARSQWQS